MAKKRAPRTIRQIRARGLVPIRFRDDDGVYHGWIAKRGTRYLHLHLIARGRVRIPLADERYVTELAP